MPIVNGWIVVVYRLWAVRLYRAGLDGDNLCAGLVGGLVGTGGGDAWGLPTGF